MLHKTSQEHLVNNYFKTILPQIVFCRNVFDNLVAHIHFSAFLRNSLLPLLFSMQLSSDFISSIVIKKSGDQH